MDDLFVHVNTNSIFIGKISLSTTFIIFIYAYLNGKTNFGLNKSITAKSVRNWSKVQILNITLIYFQSKGVLLIKALSSRIYDFTNDLNT